MNMPRELVKTLGFVLLAGIASNAQVIAKAEVPPFRVVTVNIPPKPMDEALNAFAQQTGLQLLFRTDAVAQAGMAPQVVGTYSAQDALQRLLANTSLNYKFLDERTVAIRSPQPSVSAAASSTSENKNQEDIQKSFWDRFRVAQADQGANSQSASVESDAPRSQGTLNNPKLEEIVVTAQKREERLQDVPVPVTVLSAPDLVERSQLRIRDYYLKIPGLNVAPSIQSNDVLSIRGITTGTGTNPTVGVLVDDVPYGASTSLGGGNVVPDIDPGDLARVEVLRGPQGTLYGASSMGGLIKFVTRDPSTDRLSGHLQAGVSGVQNGANSGYNFRGSVNAPVTETFAVAASAFHRRDPGYIDDPVRGIDGVNQADATGGRLAALWRPSDKWSLRLSALLQKIEGDGSSEVYKLPGLGDLQQSVAPDTGGYERKAQSYSAVLNAELGRINLTSVSGYNINAYSDSFDAGFAYGPAVRPLFGVTGAVLYDDNQTHKFSQEVRVSLPVVSKVDWLMGGFYTHEHSTYTQPIIAIDPATGAQIGEYGRISFPTTYWEYAGFTDLTFHFTDRFETQIGARESHINVTADAQHTEGPQYSGGSVIPAATSEANAFTYLLTPRFTFSRDLMAYARLASGYRTGGPNAGILASGTPAKYDPDKTRNYELGLKGTFWDGALSIDTSIYYINWNDIQISLINPQTSQAFKSNGGGAKSEGVEFSVEARPVGGLTVGAWVAYSEAVLTEPFPTTSPAHGAEGDRLPNSARWSGNLSVDEEFPVTAHVSGFAGGALSYVGDRMGVFRRTATRQSFPSYTKADLDAGMRYKSWTTTVFVTNLANRRGLLQGGLGVSPSYGFTYIQPRTIGLQVGYGFE